MLGGAAGVADGFGVDASGGGAAARGDAVPGAPLEARCETGGALVGGGVLLGASTIGCCASGGAGVAGGASFVCGRAARPLVTGAAGVGAGGGTVAAGGGTVAGDAEDVVDGAGPAATLPESDDAFRGGGSGLPGVLALRACAGGEPDGTGRVVDAEYHDHAAHPAINTAAPVAARAMIRRALGLRPSDAYPSVASTASACALRRVAPWGRAA